LKKVSKRICALFLVALLLLNLSACGASSDQPAAEGIEKEEAA